MKTKIAQRTIVLDYLMSCLLDSYECFCFKVIRIVLNAELPHNLLLYGA